MRVALAQMNSADDVARNREVAQDLVRRAADVGATIVVLPERWHFLHDDTRVVAAAETIDGPSVSAMRELARELGIALIAGSIAERSEDPRRVYNTSVAIERDGAIAGVYRKLHLFDVEVGDTVYRESSATRPGDAIVCCRLAGLTIGMSVCYDLRFPELYRRLALDGARLLVVPAAFTAATGPDHWEVLLRARAIENQCFVLAANQWGRHPHGARSHGRSTIVDPWGVVLACAADATTLVVADLDPAALDDVRRRLPALAHRRADIYGEPGRGPRAV